MIIKAHCECGNEDVCKFKEYDGMFGYEAIVCLVCGRYVDHQDKHEVDEWSKQFIIKAKGEV